jgi:hypothetical protein
MIGDSQLTDNHAGYSGGAIQLLFSGATLSGCTVSRNTADQLQGGGIDIGYFSNLTVSNNSTISNNQAPLGGDVMDDSAQFTITGSTLGSLDLLALGGDPVLTCDAAVAQTAADAAARMPAPLEPVYDNNGIHIGVAPSPATITLNLTQGTYHDLTLSTQDYVTLVVNGVGGSVGTVNGTNVVGNSPALVVTGGTVFINNVAFTTATDAPTILITGGSLTLSNDIVQESTGYNDAAIKITGGSLNLAGGNTLNINGAGQFIVSTGTSLVAATGTAYQINGVTLPTAGIDDLIARGAALPLNSGQQNSLTSTLQAAEQALLRANTTAAANQLSAFINQVNALVNSHRLSQLSADALIEEVDNLLAVLP